MKQAALTVNIPKPCTEDWDSMTPEARGRHCAACNKTVTDFTRMTDAEIIAFISRQKGEWCGRFREDQHNRPLVLPPSPGLFPRLYKAFAGLLLLCTTGSLPALAQDTKNSANAKSRFGEQAPNAREQAHPVPDSVATPTFLIQGRVTDQQTREEVPFALVRLKGTDIYTHSDIEGRFQLQVPAAMLSKTLYLKSEAEGYHAHEAVLSPNLLTIKINLRMTLINFPSPKEQEYYPAPLIMGIGLTDNGGTLTKEEIAALPTREHHGPAGLWHRWRAYLHDRKERRSYRRERASYGQE